jgi:hypothetical protein
MKAPSLFNGEGNMGGGKALAVDGLVSTLIMKLG